MKTKILLSLVLIVSIPFFFSQCKKKPTESDKVLYDKAKVTTGFTYYKNDLSYLTKSTASGHGHSFFRVRFNSIALGALTDNGKLPAGGTFPDGSLIVKEIYDTAGGDVQLLAIMEKATGNSSAGADWLWAEYHADGSLGFSISKRGNGCISCHSAAGSRDYLRLFALFP